MQGQEDKLREIRQDYSKKVKEHKLNEQVAAMHKNLTTPNTNETEELVRQMVLKFGETGMLPLAAQYVQQALAVQNIAAHSSQKSAKKDKE